MEGTLIMKSRIDETIVDISGNLSQDGGIVGDEAEIDRFALGRSQRDGGNGSAMGLPTLLDTGFRGPEHRLAKVGNEMEVKPLKTLNSAK
jgi:hypothetical protein